MAESQYNFNYSPDSGTFIMSPGNSNSSCLSSPEQQVPQYENGLVLSSNQFNHRNQGGQSPYLKIIEQPIQLFRFRYKSEMCGTHGQLSGQSNKKSHPTVQLFNYQNNAKIMCSLAQIDESHDVHPHRLVVGREDREDDDPHEIIVGPNQGYMARFQSMSIVFSAKKCIVDELMKKKLRINNNKNINLEKLEMECIQNKPYINLNSVCLKFAAYDLSGNLICDPVYSTTIDNTKSAETCPLKIVAMSTNSGSCQGGELLLLFVEKVNKKNIAVRFFEMNGNKKVWEQNGIFSDVDVHHQYGIALRTPAYRDLYLKSDVEVFVQLVRPKDNAVSQKILFTYKAYNAFCDFKRKRVYNYNQETSLPVTIETINSTHDVSPGNFQENSNVSHHSFITEENMHNYAQKSTEISGGDDLIDLDCSELINFFFNNCEGSEFEGSAVDMLPEGYGIDVMPDSVNISNKCKPVKIKPGEDLLFDKIRKHYSDDDLEIFIKYVILFKGEMNNEKNKLIQNLLFTNLSNEDSLLHMLTTYNLHQLLLKTIEFLKKIKKVNFLNTKNKFYETPLHRSIKCNHLKSSELLLKSGSNPNIRDGKGLTPMHLAVFNSSSGVFDLLVKHISKSRNILDCNVLDKEGFSPLHYAVMMENLDIVRSLLDAGANINFKTGEGKNILHLATEKNSLTITQFILNMEKIVINEKTHKGYTALHFACKNNNIEMVKLLLQRKANPQIRSNEMSPLKFAKQSNTKIYEIMQQYVLDENVNDIKREITSSDSEDESSISGDSVDDELTSDESTGKSSNTTYESFDSYQFLDAETRRLVAMSLDNNGKWKDLLTITNSEGILSLCNTESPSNAVLNDMEFEKKTQDELYAMLMQINDKETAKILKGKHIKR